MLNCLMHLCYNECTGGAKRSAIVFSYTSVILWIYGNFIVGEQWCTTRDIILSLSDQWKKAHSAERLCCKMYFVWVLINWKQCCTDSENALGCLWVPIITSVCITVAVINVHCSLLAWQSRLPSSSAQCFLKQPKVGEVSVISCNNLTTYSGC